MTITEALAEMKTVVKRIEAKRKSVTQYLVRSEALKDPMEKDGGSQKYVEQEMQAIADLENRLVELRCAIDDANNATAIQIEDQTRTISEWLIWRREVAPKREKFLKDIQMNIHSIREGIRRGDFARKLDAEMKQQDIVVNFDEQALAKEVELLGSILGQLDGQLSLKNATITVDVD